MLTGKERIKEILAAGILWFLMLWEDIKDILQTVIITFVVCLLVSNYLFKPVVVDGSSMYPTVENGAVGFSSVLARKTGNVNRFDIVVINMESRGKLLIKRVIGLPGETVEYIDGTLYINGVETAEPFLNEEYVNSQLANSTDGVFTKDYSITLGEDEYFCMGDNRLVSADSRVYGPFKYSDILSCGIFVVYPFSSFGKVK